MAEQKSSSLLTAPLHGAASVLRRVPGAGVVGRAAQETLDRVGAVSPRGRRMAVYTGAGVLGVAGVVEWPVALTGAAVAWLTQPRPEHSAPAQALERTTNGGQPAAQEAAPGGGPETGEAAPEGGTGGAEPARKRAPNRKAAPAQDVGAAALTSSPPSPQAAARSRSAPDTGATGRPAAQQPEASAEGRATGGSAPGQASTGPLGPTARPGRTTR
ncbi:hypothetical protein [Streptomyces mexicanus]|uniref:hypothetical protein n=1 Tax=Streptomyces mexicanus TaxID=178566 RepID=UPI0036BAE9FA